MIKKTGDLEQMVTPGAPRLCCRTDPGWLGNLCQTFRADLLLNLVGKLWANYQAMLLDFGHSVGNSHEITKTLSQLPETLTKAPKIVKPVKSKPRRCSKIHLKKY